MQPTGAPAPNAPPGAGGWRGTAPATLRRSPTKRRNDKEPKRSRTYYAEGGREARGLPGASPQGTGAKGPTLCERPLFPSGGERREQTRRRYLFAAKQPRRAGPQRGRRILGGGSCGAPLRVSRLPPFFRQHNDNGQQLHLINSLSYLTTTGSNNKATTGSSCAAAAAEPRREAARRSLNNSR